MKRTVVSIVVVLALVAGSALAAAPAARLAGRVEVQQTAFAPSEPVALTLRLANRGDASAWVLRWQVPSDRIEADMLEVTRNGEPVEYLGRLVKRPAPTAADWVEIAAGSELAVTFDPTGVYDMAPRGHYTVTFKAWQLDVLTGDAEVLLDAGQAKGARRAAVPELVDSQAAEFWFDGLEVEISVEAEGIGGYTGCSTNQMSRLQTAHSNAITYSNKAKQHLAANSRGSSLYTWWFGSYLKKRFSTVVSHYNAINSAFATKSVTYDCSCTDDYYAYVYPSRPYKIYVCNAFWQAPTTGRDSKMGTLIHEMSHFKVVASTDDYVYGATGAHNLALSSPNKAVDNADNHEYFAEDQ